MVSQLASLVWFGLVCELVTLLTLSIATAASKSSEPKRIVKPTVKFTGCRPSPISTWQPMSKTVKTLETSHDNCQYYFPQKYEVQFSIVGENNFGFGI